MLRKNKLELFIKTVVNQKYEKLLFFKNKSRCVVNFLFFPFNTKTTCGSVLFIDCVFFCQNCLKVKRYAPKLLYTLNEKVQSNYGDYFGIISICVLAIQK